MQGVRERDPETGSSGRADRSRVLCEMRVGALQAGASELEQAGSESGRRDVRPMTAEQWRYLRECVEEALAEAPEGSECQGWLIGALSVLDDVESQNRKRKS